MLAHCGVMYRAELELKLFLAVVAKVSAVRREREKTLCFIHDDDDDDSREKLFTRSFFY